MPDIGRAPFFLKRTSNKPKLRHDLNNSTPLSTIVDPTANLYDTTNRRIRRRSVKYNVSVSTPYSTIDQDLLPSLYIDGDTFYTSDVVLQEIPTQNLIDSRIFRRQIRRIHNFSVGTPYSTIDQDLTPSLYVDTDTFYTSIVTTTVDLAPSLYIDLDTFYTPIVSLQEIPTPNFIDPRISSRRRVVKPRNFSISTPFSTIDFDLTPSLYLDGDTFYAPVVTGGTVDLQPSLYVDDDTFYTPTVDQEVIPTSSSSFDQRKFRRRVLPRFNASASTPFSIIDRELSPSLYVDVDTFYTPTVTPGAVDLTPSLYVDADTFYTPVVTTGSVDLTTSLYVDVDTFYTLVVTPGTVDLVPTLYIDPDTFYTPIVSAAGAISTTLYIDPDTFYSPIVTTGSVDVQPSLYIDPDTFYTPTISGVVTPSPDQPPIFGGISPPPRIPTVVNVVIQGIILTCFAKILPGKVEIISLIPGFPQAGAVVGQSNMAHTTRIKFVETGRPVCNEVTDDDLRDLLSILDKI